MDCQRCRCSHPTLSKNAVLGGDGSGARSCQGHVCHEARLTSILQYHCVLPDTTPSEVTTATSNGRVALNNNTRRFELGEVQDYSRCWKHDIPFSNASTSTAGQASYLSIDDLSRLTVRDTVDSMVELTNALAVALFSPLLLEATSTCIGSCPV